MSYVYDILLNFQSDFYDFFEWNQDDEVVHIRKIPLFLISNDDYKVILNSIVCFDKGFCERIYNQTERFKKANVSLLHYVFLISNGKECMGLKLNKNGLVLGKSSLLLDEGEDVCFIANDLKIFNIEYNVVKSSFPVLQTRCERENIFDVSNKLSLLYNHRDDDKIRFLYLECFGECESDVNKAFARLQSEIHNNRYVFKMIDFFDILGQK